MIVRALTVWFMPFIHLLNLLKMKKVMMMAVAILFSSVSVFAADLHKNATVADTAKKAKPAKVVYTCPMHSDVLSDKPGKCPKPGCGMTLVKKAGSKKPAQKMKM
jgi:hypothetical protein